MKTADKIGLLPGFGPLADHGFVTTLLLCWLITPGMHLLVGMVLETRFVPLDSQHQFLSFFPGDLFLGGFAAGLLVAAKSLPDQLRWYNATWWHMLVLIVCMVAAIGLTWVEWHSGAYPAGAILSPTKLYHNGVLYILYGYVIVVTLVAVLAAARSWWLPIVFVFGAVWLGLVVIDNSYSGEVSIQKAAGAHTADWRPLWIP